MAGIGHMAEFAKRTRELNATRRERRENYKKQRTFYDKSKIKLHFKKVSPEKLKEIKAKYMLKLKQDRTKNSIALAVALIVGIPIFVFVGRLFINIYS